MEILNNIWNALNTENDVLTKAITLPMMFIEVSLSLYIFLYFLKIDLNKKKKTIYIILVSINSILTNLFVASPINILINYIFIFVLVFNFFGFTFAQTILSIVIPFATFGLVNSLIMNPLLKLFNITLQNLITIPIYRFLY